MRLVSCRFCCYFDGVWISFVHHHYHHKRPSDMTPSPPPSALSVPAECEVMAAASGSNQKCEVRLRCSLKKNVWTQCGFEGKKKKNQDWLESVWVREGGLQGPWSVDFTMGVWVNRKVSQYMGVWMPTRVWVWVSGSSRWFLKKTPRQPSWNPPLSFRQRCKRRRRSKKRRRKRRRKVEMKQEGPSWRGKRQLRHNNITWKE